MNDQAWLLTCSKCYKDLPEEAYDRNPLKPEDFRVICRECYAKTKTYKGRARGKSKQAQPPP